MISVERMILDLEFILFCMGITCQLSAAFSSSSLDISFGLSADWSVGIVIDSDPNLVYESLIGLIWDNGFSEKCYESSVRILIIPLNASDLCNK